MRGPCINSLLGRRQLLAGLMGVGLAACTRQADTAMGGSTFSPRFGHGARAQAKVELYSVFDLPHDDARSKELSGIAWDAAANVLWAVQDEAPHVVALQPGRELRSWSFGETVQVSCDGTLDLEGVVLTKDGFLLASETGPRVIEVARSGKFLRELPLPERFRDARNNKSLESLTLSPSGRYLFTTTEVALPRDGDVATLEAGTRVRLVRIDRETGKIDEYAYATDPSPYAYGDWGVADLAALSDDELLVLERGWAALRGNTARIHHVTIDERTSTCSQIDALSAATPVVTKKLYIDLGHLASEAAAKGLPEPKQPQSSPLMDNYEGLAIGPKLEDGRSTLIVISDDNAHANQVARILVLACS